MGASQFPAVGKMGRAIAIPPGFGVRRAKRRFRRIHSARHNPNATLQTEALHTPLSPTHSVQPISQFANQRTLYAPLSKAPVLSKYHFGSYQPFIFLPRAEN